MTGTPASPIVELCDETVLLDYADERSVVQTRFATTALALARAHLGDDIGALADAAEGALTEPLPFDTGGVHQFVFLGHGMAVGAGARSRAQAARGGRRLDRSLPLDRVSPRADQRDRRRQRGLGLQPGAGGPPEAVRATGAAFLQARRDPMVELIVAQRLAVALAQGKGLDPDHPRHLTRSVILPS